MNFNISDRAWFIRHPRWATLANAVMMILAATGCGIIAEWALQMRFDIAPLGIWAVLAVAGSVTAAAVRLHDVAVAIALGEEPVTVHDNQGQEHTQPVKQNTSLERATDRINESFHPVTSVISAGILAAASILITQHHPDTAAQLTPTWVKSYPISTAAFASATGIVLTSAKTVESLLGQGHARAWVVRAGKFTLIATSIGLAGFASVGAIGIIWLIFIGITKLVMLISRIF